MTTCSRSDWKSRLVILSISFFLSRQCQCLPTTFDVTTNADTGAGSLRTEIGLSNTAGGSNTIDWTTGGTITLGSDLPSINDSTTLDVTGAGSAVTIAGTSFQMPLGGAVTFTNNSVNLWTISSIISGSGSLTNLGTGTLLLTGSNTYTGGTAIGGTLEINGDAALGSTSGGITFEGGTLELSASTASARTIDLLSPVNTINTNGNTLVLTGVLGGTGGLNVNDPTGTGLLSLSGSNTYSGGTTLTSGTLGVNSSAALGSGNIIFQGGTLQIQANSFSDSQNITLNLGSSGTFETSGSTATFSGLISGGGALIETSSGTLVLSGANNYTGGTTINGGTIQIANDNNIGSGGTLSLLNGGTLRTSSSITDSRAITLGAGGGTIDTNGYDPVFSGVIGGSGSLTKVGNGILNLAGGIGDDYTGGTTIAAGTLQLGANDSLPANGNLSIANGATFDMNGFSQTNNVLGAVSNAGLINVGAGSLAVNSYAGTGTLGVQLRNGFTNVTATSANLAGGTLAVSLANPFVTRNQTFTPITAGSITGQFAGPIQGPAALSFTPTYNPGSVVLTVGYVPFAASAASANQAAVGSGLEGLRAAAVPTGDAATVLSSLYTLNSAQLQSALDQIGPITLGAMRGISLTNSNLQSSAVDQRTTALAQDSDIAVYEESRRPSSYPGTLLAANTDMGALTPSADKPDWSTTPWGTFGSIIGTQGQLDSVDNGSGQQAGYSFTSGGLNVGADYRFSDNFALGLTGGYLRGRATVNAPDTGVVSDQSTRLGAYAAFFSDNVHANLYAGGAIDSFDTSRDIVFGSIDRTATAQPEGREINVHSIANYSIDATDTGGLSPFLGMDYDNLNIDSFSESGANALDLNVGSQSSTSLRSALGVGWSFDSHSGWNDVRTYVRAGWRHEFENQDRPIEAQLASGSGSVFSVNSGTMARDGLLAEAGFMMELGGDTIARLDYTGDYRPQFKENSLEASLRFRF